MPDYDVVVVGAGNAALAAANSAKENGAKKVLVLEKANRKERAGITSRGKKVDTASLRGTGRRGGRGIVRAKGGLMTKPAIKNMKRGGLASR